MGGMWTKEHRARQAAFERRRYPTDLTDEEWERVGPLLPRPAERGRPPNADMREVLNAIRYLARAGCGWRLLFRTIHDTALMLDRMTELACYAA